MRSTPVTMRDFVNMASKTLPSGPPEEADTPKPKTSKGPTKIGPSPELFASKTKKMSEDEDTDDDFNNFEDDEDFDVHKSDTEEEVVPSSEEEEDESDEDMVNALPYNNANSSSEEVSSGSSSDEDEDDTFSVSVTHQGVVRPKATSGSQSLKRPRSEGDATNMQDDEASRPMKRPNSVTVPLSNEKRAVGKKVMVYNGKFGTKNYKGSTGWIIKSSGQSGVVCVPQSHNGKNSRKTDHIKESDIKNSIASGKKRFEDLYHVVVLDDDSDPSKKNQGVVFAGFIICSEDQQNNSKDMETFYTVTLTLETDLFKEIFRDSKEKGGRQAKLKAVSTNNYNDKAPVTIYDDVRKANFTFDSQWVSDPARASLCKEQERSKRASEAKRGAAKKAVTSNPAKEAVPQPQPQPPKPVPQPQPQPKPVPQPQPKLVPQPQPKPVPQPVAPSSVPRLPVPRLRVAPMRQHSPLVSDQAPLPLQSQSSLTSAQWGGVPPGTTSFDSFMRHLDARGMQEGSFFVQGLINKQGIKRNLGINIKINVYESRN